MTGGQGPRGADGAPLAVALDVSCAANPRPTGVGLAVAHLARALRAHRATDAARDLKVRLVCRWSRLRRRAALGDLAPHVGPYDERWSWLLARRTAVFHGPDARLPRLRGPARVATLHDLSARRPAFATDRFRALREAHWAAAARDAALLVTYTRAVRDEVAAGLGVPPARIAVVPLAATDDAAPRDPAAREAAVAAVGRRVAGGRPWVLVLGERSARKNTAGAAAALRAAGGALADHALVVVGPPGHGAAAADAALAHPGLRGRVVVCDYLPAAEVAALLAGARALLFPTRYEGFGLPVLEALRAGVPVVASEDPSVVEVAGGAALHASADDADGLGALLVRAALDPALRADLAARGRAREAAFTWARCARGLAAVYRAAAAGAPAPEDPAGGDPVGAPAGGRREEVACGSP